MNNLVNVNIQTMSSKEIAELTGKRHDHILRDIKNILSELDSPKMGNEHYQELKDNRGFTAEFLLDKELSTILVSGYSVQMRAKIVRRWLELENKAIQETTPKLISSEEYISEVRKAKLEVERGKAAIHNCKVDAAKIKLEELKNRVYNRIKVMNEKHAKILSRSEIKIKADMTASKEHIPHDTVTNLLKKHGITLKPSVFNNLLIKHGYLMPNRQEVTEKGNFFGHTVKASSTVKTPYPRWYISEFTTLLLELSQLEPDVFK